MLVFTIFHKEPQNCMSLKSYIYLQTENILVAISFQIFIWYKLQKGMSIELSKSATGKGAPPYTREFFAKYFRVESRILKIHISETRVLLVSGRACGFVPIPAYRIDLCKPDRIAPDASPPACHFRPLITIPAACRCTPYVRESNINT